MGEFREALKLYRKSIYQKTGKFPKPDRKGIRWLYPFAVERTYGVYIMDYVKTFTKLNMGWIEDNLPRFLEQNRSDSKAIIREDWFDQYGIWNEKKYQCQVKRDSINRTDSSIRLDEYYNELDQWNEDLRELQRNHPTYTKGNMIASIQGFGFAVDAFNKTQFDKFAQQAIKNQFIPDSTFSRPLVEAWAQTNYELITSLPQEYIKKANTIVSEGVQRGRLYSDITDDLRKLDKTLSQSRARLIARDQIGKLNGVLAQQRMEDADLNLYTWLTSKDERVRGNPSGRYPRAIPSHFIMEGILCKWKDKTVYSDDKGKTWKARTGKMPQAHPGEEIQCRCGPIPYWDEIVADVDGEIIQEIA